MCKFAANWGNIQKKELIIMNTAHTIQVSVKVVNYGMLCYEDTATTTAEFANTSTLSNGSD